MGNINIIWTHVRSTFLNFTLDLLSQKLEGKAVQVTLMYAQVWEAQLE